MPDTASSLRHKEISLYNQIMVTSSRAAREELILSAALEELTATGTVEVTMAEIATRTGLTRTAIYQYFSSVSDIFAELIINDMSDLVNDIELAVANEGNPVDQIRAWVHYSLAHLSSGEHAVIRRLSETKLPQEKRGVVRALHGQFMKALLSPVKELDLENADAICAYVASVTNSAANRIDLGMDFIYEAKAAEDFVMAAISHSKVAD